MAPVSNAVRPESSTDRNLPPARCGPAALGSCAGKLYVCWGTFQTPRPGGHPCGNAYKALREAGYEPDVEKVHGLGIGPIKMTGTPGRKEVKELTGQSVVPVLVTDEGEAIHDSKEIVEWAKAPPAAAGTQA